MLSIFLPIFLGWAALACQGKSLIVSASFAQRSSFSSSFPSFSFSFSNQLAAENMVSFKHEQLIKVLLANEAYTLPPSLLKHVNKQLEDHPEELEAAFFKELLPELPEPDELEFFLVLGELAMKSFKQTSFNQLPPQKVKGASNANLGNWQASSSFAKAVSFWAWTACQAPELAAEAACVISFKFKVQSFAVKHKALQLGHTISLDFRGADCQLCFWGKQQASQHLPTFSSLNIKLGEVIFKLAAFEQIEQLYEKASFGWGGASSEHNLPAFWKHDLQQHPSVYKKLAEKLGMDSPMAKLIVKELDKDEEEPASKLPKTSTASEAEFWMTASKNLRKLFGDTFRSAEQLLAQQASEAAAWQGTFAEGTAATASDDERSGRIDGSLPSLQCGEGNIPLHLKLQLAQHLGSFKP